MHDDPRYRDARLPIHERVADLLSRMTLEEKAAQTSAPFGTVVDVHAPQRDGWGAAVAGLSTLGLPAKEMAERANALQRTHIEQTRLGIPVLIAEEALVGLKVRGATTFPDSIAQAATWAPDLIEEMGRRIGQQMARLGVRQALSPLADVARDPRWGRVDETYGEEPFLVGSMAAAYVRGLQNADPATPVIATLKHFLGYAASDGGRNTEPATIGDRAVRETYGVPFEMAIRNGGALGVMPAYNALDGIPVSGSRNLLQKLLRDEWGFDGIVISDLAAVSQLHSKHHVAVDHQAAIGQALHAGIDLDLDNEVSTDRIVAAVRAGTIAEIDLDRAVAEVLRMKFRLGLFERPYVDLDVVPESLDSDPDRTLARTIAERSIVLLQNDPVGGEPLLPLKPSIKRVAVIGPNADRLMGQLGHYSYQVLDSMTTRFAFAANPQSRYDESAGGTGSADDVELLVESVPVVTFLDGIRSRLGPEASVVHERGCPIAALDRSGFPAAVQAAEQAEVAVVVLGDQAGINSYGTVGEGLDSATCELPGVQRELLEAILATGTPTVVVLSHGRPFVLGWMAERAPAIVTAFFGGEEAGNALASMLFGDESPSGKLPIALLSSVGAAPVPYWRSLGSAGYVDGSVKAVFPFGHGLSYTRFAYTDLRIEAAQVPTNGRIRLSFSVENTGDRPGDEIVQIYGQDVDARTVRPGRVLLAFRRVALDPGAVERVTVEVAAERFSLWDTEDGWIVEPGMVRLFVGGSSASTPLQGSVRLTGEIHRAGPGRQLGSLTVLDAPEFAHDAATAPGEPARLTADSTVQEWLDHPRGGPAIRRALADLGAFDETALTPALGLPLQQMIAFSAGRVPAEILPGLLESARVKTPRIDDSSTVREWLDHPIGGPILRGALGDHDEEELAPAFGVPLAQMLAYSRGRLPDGLLAELLTATSDSDR